MKSAASNSDLVFKDCFITSLTLSGDAGTEGSRIKFSATFQSGTKVASGELTGVLNNDDDYTFEVAFASTTGNKGMIYKIEDAKLNSYNYGMSVNGQMTFDAEFSFKVTETNGLKVSGSQYT